MSKLTLLDMTQRILRDINSDAVNSINDTPEAQEIARIIEDVYYNLITNDVIPENNGLTQLDGLADTNLPNYLLIPEGVDKITFIRYNVSEDIINKDQWKDLNYKTPYEFLQSLPTQVDTGKVRITDPSGVSLVIRNDKMPSFWTSFDDNYIVCDSYDSNTDSTLQSSKTQSFAKFRPDFDPTDDNFIPDIDANFFPLLLAESKSMAFAVLKQAANPKIEQQVRQQKTKVQNDRYRTADGNFKGWPNYGR